MEPEVTPFAVQDAYGAPATLVPNHVGARTVREELYMTQKRILRDKRNAALAVSPAYLSELSTRLAAGGKMSLQAQTALRLVQDNDVDLVPRVTRLGTSISPPPSRRLGTWSRQQRTQRLAGFESASAQPLRQSSHAEDPGPASLPAGHCAQASADAAAGDAEARPARQSEHSAEPDAAQRPAPHSVQSSDAFSVAKVPELHERQVVLPAALA